jgi:hypothetical protein
MLATLVRNAVHTPEPYFLRTMAQTHARQVIAVPAEDWRPFVALAFDASAEEAQAERLAALREVVRVHPHSAAIQSQMWEAALQGGGVAVAAGACRKFATLMVTALAKDSLVYAGHFPSALLCKWFTVALERALRAGSFGRANQKAALRVATALLALERAVPGAVEAAPGLEAVLRELLLRKPGAFGVTHACYQLLLHTQRVDGTSALAVLRAHAYPERLCVSVLEAVAAQPAWGALCTPDDTGRLLQEFAFFASDASEPAKQAMLTLCQRVPPFDVPPMLRRWLCKFSAAEREPGWAAISSVLGAV